MEQTFTGELLTSIYQKDKIRKSLVQILLQNLIIVPKLNCMNCSKCRFFFGVKTIVLYYRVSSMIFCNGLKSTAFKPSDKTCCDTTTEHSFLHLLSLLLHWLTDPGSKIIVRDLIFAVVMNQILTWISSLISKSLDKIGSWNKQHISNDT